MSFCRLFSNEFDELYLSAIFVYGRQQPWVGKRVQQPGCQAGRFQVDQATTIGSRRTIRTDLDKHRDGCYTRHAVRTTGAGHGPESHEIAGVESHIRFIQLL